MRKRKLPAPLRTFGRFFRHTRRVNPWHDFQECNRIARATYWYRLEDPIRRARWERQSARLNSERRIAQDTLSVTFVPGRRWPDGEVSSDQWMATIHHRNSHPTGRTTYVGARTRAEALEKLEKHVCGSRD